MRIPKGTVLFDIVVTGCMVAFPGLCFDSLFKIEFFQFGIGLFPIFQIICTIGMTGRMPVRTILAGSVSCVNR